MRFCKRPLKIKINYQLIPLMMGFTFWYTRSSTAVWNCRHNFDYSCHVRRTLACYPKKEYSSQNQLNAGHVPTLFLFAVWTIWSYLMARISTLSRFYSLLCDTTPQFILVIKLEAPSVAQMPSTMIRYVLAGSLLDHSACFDSWPKDLQLVYDFLLKNHLSRIYRQLLISNVTDIAFRIRLNFERLVSKRKDQPNCTMLVAV